MRGLTLGMLVALLATSLMLVGCGSGEEAAAGDGGAREQASSNDAAAPGGDGATEPATEGDGAGNGSETSAVDSDTDSDSDSDTDSDSDSVDSDEGDSSNAPFKSASHEGYELRWRVLGENLEVSVSYATTGWVAVGFDPTRMMRDANIIIGYVADGEAVITDQYGNSTITHRPDTDLGGSDDLTSASGTEEDGVTTLSFVMPLDSGDEYDRALEPGETYTVILAHGADGVDDMETYHEGRASMEITL